MSLRHYRQVWLVLQPACHGITKCEVLVNNEHMNHDDTGCSDGIAITVSGLSPSPAAAVRGLAG